jgi:hypothetical protein
LISPSITSASNWSKATALILLLVTTIAAASALVHSSAKANANIQLLFRYGVGAKNVLDTFAGSFTKDLIGDSPVTTKMTLTEDELHRIEVKLDEVGFFNKSDWDLLPHGKVAGSMTPYSTFYLRVSLNGVVRELRWNNQVVFSGEVSGPIDEVIDLVLTIIEAKPEYRSLPDARGGYA